MARAWIQADPLFLTVALCAAPLVPALGQQRVVGDVSSGDTGAPVEGAMVVLLQGEQAVASVLTAADGSFGFVIAHPGVYVLQVDRIGYASTLSGPFEVGIGATVRRRIETEVRAVRLAGLRVEGSRRCDLDPSEAAPTATVWEEARKALAAARWTSDREAFRLTWIRYDRDLAPAGERVLRERRRRTRALTPRPFRSVDIETLARQGFVRREGDDLLYAAPDAEVLLSDYFLSGHCLSLVRARGADESLIGIRFEPVDGQRLSDVEGTIWLDEDSGRLSSVEYVYVNLRREGPIDGDEASGRLTFRGLPNGTWIVEDWKIRMPLLASRVDGFGRTIGYQVRGYVEEGGSVTEIASASGVVLGGAVTGVQGTVTDSLGDAASGARVWIEGTELGTRTDAEGSFAITEMSAGRWTLRATHPALEAVGHEGVEAPVEVERDQLRPVRLGLPSIRDVLSNRCRGTDTTGAVLAGRVARSDGTPAAQVAVRAMWTRGAAFEGFGTTTDERGVFVLCGLPPGRALTASATAAEAGAPEAVRSVEIPTADAFAVLDLRIEDAPAEAPVPADVAEEALSRSAETGRWLRSVGFDLRRDVALGYYTERQLAGYDSVPAVLETVPRFALERALSGRTTLNLLAEDSAKEDNAVACEVTDFYINGSLVRQNIGVDWEAQMVRRYPTRVVSGLEAFDGTSAPVGPPEACGAVLFWVSHERDVDDPDFAGSLSGRIVAAGGATLAGLEVRASPGSHLATVDEQGAFAFGALPPAVYLIEVTIPGWGEWRHRVIVRAYADASVRIELGGDAVSGGRSAALR